MHDTAHAFVSSIPRLRLVPPVSGMEEPASGRFGLVPDAVYALGNGYAIAVYAALAKHADRAGDCHPSVARLAAITGWSAPTIHKALKLLAEAGLIVILHRDLGGMKRSNAYRLPLHPPRQKSPTEQMETSLPSAAAPLPAEPETPSDQMETSLASMETSFASDGNVVDIRWKPRLQEVEATEPEPEEGNGDSVPEPLDASASPLAVALEPEPEHALVPAESPPPKPPVPFDLIIAVCAAQEQDYRALSAAERKKQGAVASRLSRNGVTPDDVVALVGWLRDQTWMTSGIDLFTVERYLTRWKLQGKPPAAGRRVTGRAPTGARGEWTIEDMAAFGRLMKERDQ